MIINRDIYLNQLIDRMNNGMIKVVTGLRRSGKSFLINRIFHDYLKSTGVDDEHIITVQLDVVENENLLDRHILFEYLRERIKDNNQYYIFLDEIQEVDGFESVLNSFLRIENVDLYVTGSNSKFLSSDIKTELRGRGDEIHVNPLSFKEFYSVNKKDEIAAWNEYMIYGGMPMIVSKKRTSRKQNI